jgi:Bardet-Biedl syndrome 2 protein
VTAGGKINLYIPPNPHEKVSKENALSTHSLNINRNITCIEFCPLQDEEEIEKKERLMLIRKPKTKKNSKEKEEKKPKKEEKDLIPRKSEVLFIGCEISLLCYDIMENKTLFDREITEGVLCMACGRFSNFNEPLCLAGGNCNIVGIDINGEEKFWTVLGGNAICMELGYYLSDNNCSLFVGTDDYTIRIYKDEEPLLEINENTKIVIICPIEDDYFCYGLETGTVGLYKGKDKKWTKKEKGYCTAMEIRDFKGEGTVEVLVGMSTGKIVFFDANTGKEYFNFYVNHPISKFFYGDFILSQRNIEDNILIKQNDIEEEEDEDDQIICFTENGDVYGYIYGNKNFISTEHEYESKDKKVREEDLNEYEALLKEKNKLLDELEDLAVRESNRNKINAPKEGNELPQTLKVDIDLESNDKDKCADLTLEATDNAIIKAVIISSEQIYQGETFVKYPKSESNNAIVQIKTKKDLHINLHIKVLLGTNSLVDDYIVLEYNKIIPKYCFYILLREEDEYKSKLKQGISFTFDDRIERLILFLEEKFNIPAKEISAFKKDDANFKIRFRSLRTDIILEINVLKGNKLSILTDEIELCGNLVQDLAQFLNKEDLNTNIDYKKYAQSYEEIFNRIEELDNERNHLNINMSDIITNIKDLYVKAEDNRLIDNIKGFKDYFRKIDVQNNQLLDEFEKRSEKYQQLLSDLKSVNEMIQLGSNLKCGKYKKEMVSECRKCIKNKDYALLMKIISSGESH